MGSLKKEYNLFISKRNTHDLQDNYFPEGVWNRNEDSNVRDKNSINMNEPILLNVMVNYCALRCIA